MALIESAKISKSYWGEQHKKRSVLKKGKLGNKQLWTKMVGYSDQEQVDDLDDILSKDTRPWIFYIPEVTIMF